MQSSEGGAPLFRWCFFSKGGCEVPSRLIFLAVNLAAFLRFVVRCHTSIQAHQQNVRLANLCVFVSLVRQALFCTGSRARGRLSWRRPWPIRQAPRSSASWGPSLSKSAWERLEPINGFAVVSLNGIVRV